MSPFEKPIQRTENLLYTLLYAFIGVAFTGFLGAIAYKINWLKEDYLSQGFEYVATLEVTVASLAFISWVLLMIMRMREKKYFETLQHLQSLLLKVGHYDSPAKAIKDGTISEAVKHLLIKDRGAGLGAIEDLRELGYDWEATIRWQLDTAGPVRNPLA